MHANDRQLHYFHIKSKYSDSIRFPFQRKFINCSCSLKIEWLRTNSDKKKPSTDIKLFAFQINCEFPLFENVIQIQLLTNFAHRRHWTHTACWRIGDAMFTFAGHVILNEWATNTAWKWPGTTQHNGNRNRTVKWEIICYGSFRICQSRALMCWCHHFRFSQTDFFIKPSAIVIIHHFLSEWESFWDELTA